MDKKDLIVHLYKLYDDYDVDKTLFNEKSIDNIVKGIKGYLAILDKEKKKEYSDEDIVLIKKIYYYFC